MTAGGLLLAGSPPPVASQVLARWDGWIPELHTWTFSSAPGSNLYVVTVPADITAYVGQGAKIKCTNQGSTQYFFVVAISVAAGTTTVTLYGGTGSSLTNTAITNVSYSWADVANGFPQNPALWTQAFFDTTTRFKTAPVNGTWYNTPTAGGTFGQLVIPIGIWWVRYDVDLQCLSNSTNNVQISAYCTLSTANNSESDQHWTAQAYMLSQENTTPDWTNEAINVSRSGSLVVAATATYYLNVKTDLSLTASAQIGTTGGNVPTYIAATIKWAL